MPSPEVRRFLLPDLGEGLEDAEVVAWRVGEGDPVELNQTVVEVNTAKALVEIPAPWAGVVEKLHAGEGDVVRVGAPLISIRVGESGDGGAPTAEATPGRRPILVGYGVEEDDGGARQRTRRQTERAGAARQGPVAASPPVRRLAKEMGIDLAVVSGTGRGGRVTREDLKAIGQSVPVTFTFGEEQRIPVRGIRRMIAEKMTRSITEIPQVTTFLTIDASHLLAFRHELVQDTGERITPLPIVVRALVETCKSHPKLNSSFDSERSEIVMRGSCNVGIATDTEQGLLVPVIHDAGDMGIVALSHQIARLTEAARAGKSAPQDMVGGTITVTNVGTFGAEFGTPIINHPEAAILALGVIEPRALIVDGRVEARPAVTLSLSFDHRVMDGAEAGRALKALGALLENPFKLGALPR